MFFFTFFFHFSLFLFLGAENLIFFGLNCCTMRNQRGLVLSFSRFVQISYRIHPESDRLCHIWCFVICAQIDKCTRVFSLESAEPIQELSFCLPIRKSAASLRIHSYVICWCSSPGYFLRKLNQDLKFVYLDPKLEYPRTLRSANPLFGSSAHSVKCGTCCLVSPRTLRSARLVIGNIFVLWKAVRYRVRHIW